MKTFELKKVHYISIDRLIHYYKDMDAIVLKSLTHLHGEDKAKARLHLNDSEHASLMRRIETLKHKKKE